MKDTVQPQSSKKVLATQTLFKRNVAATQVAKHTAKTGQQQVTRLDNQRQRLAEIEKQFAQMDEEQTNNQSQQSQVNQDCNLPQRGCS